MPPDGSVPCGAAVESEAVTVNPSRLVVVANRIPMPRDRGPRAGGLAVALADAIRPGSLWFGWSGKRAEAPAEAARVETGKDASDYATIDLSEQEYQDFYIGFANSALWPLLHYRPDLLRYRRSEYHGYREVNRRYAANLAPLLRQDDLIWVHDYHLFPLGEELRRLNCSNRTGFFLHIPFIPPELFDCLPCAEDLLRAMSCYDVIGFHTESYRGAYLDCIRQILGIIPAADGSYIFTGRLVKTVVAPVGIDADAFARDAQQVSRGAEAQRLRASLGGGALAVGVDRLDYTKGLPNRFIAFQLLLERFPEHRRQISFLQIAVHSREDQDDYQSLRHELDRIAGDTNGQFSEFDWMPLRYMTRALRRRTLAGILRHAQIGLVTPLRDGMNLVAMEFIAAQAEHDPGVLILSRFAGAAGILPEALIVNPFDPEGIAEAIHAALIMPLEERRERHQALLAHIRATSGANFCRTFLSALRAVP
jgi:trehalose 6-phosphate synthase